MSKTQEGTEMKDFAFYEPQIRVVITSDVWDVLFAASQEETEETLKPVTHEQSLALRLHHLSQY